MPLIIFEVKIAKMEQKDTDTALCKKELRRHVRAALAGLSSAQKRAQSENVIRQIEQSDEFRAADNIAVFWSLDDEVYTHEAVRRWAGHKHIFLPVVCGDDMVFMRYHPGAELQKGELDIECPQNEEVIAPEELDLVIVPGMAFDSDGNRMGRGKGFYDRYLSSITATKIGICFGPQLVDSVPCLPHDVKMDRVVSPE